MFSKGIIFDIHYSAIYDGPGLRTCVFFKGCPLSCQWCQNPESHLLHPQIAYSSGRCLSCGQCAKACPQGLLEMANNIPVRNQDGCTRCGKCVQACHRRATELIGVEVTSSEILLKVQRDRPFYESSGGGVTISGGEPTMQEKFLINTLIMIKKDSIPTALETCGYFKADLTNNLIDVVDLFLFDIKHIDANLHNQYTGVTNEVIKRNFEEILMRAGPDKIIPRIPLIPGFNTDKGSIYAIVDYFKSVSYSGEVHLMPYNPLARTKWEKIGRSSEYKNFGDLTENDIARIVNTFEKSNFTVVCNS